MKNCAKTDNTSVGEASGVMKWVSRIIILAGVIGIAFVAFTEAYPKFTSASPAAVSHQDSSMASLPTPVPEKWIAIHLLGWWHWSEEYADLDDVPRGTPFQFFVPVEGAKVEWADGSTSKLNPSIGRDFSGSMGPMRFKGPKGEKVYICLGWGCEKESHAPREVEYPQSIPAAEGEERLANDDTCDSGSCPYRR